MGSSAGGVGTGVPARTPAGREVVITRTFDAPRDLVFRAWTDPEMMMRWWGPRWFTTPECALDVRPGGALFIRMRGPDGVDYPMRGVYQEVVEPERLVYTNLVFEDEEGNYGLEVLTTVTFAEQGGKTEVTIVERVLKSTPAVQGALAGMEEGMNQSLDRLAELLGS